jgi:hypothetical protein
MISSEASTLTLIPLAEGRGLSFPATRQVAGYLFR